MLEVEKFRAACIALISALCKICDICLLDRYQKHLQTADLQFSFKKNHSTVMCNTVLKETVNYYLDRGSNVYCCMLDASKAFDRIRYDRLFSILIDRGLPSIIVRNLLDMYMRQKVRTAWDGEFSEYFTVTNGIRQGGIVSPILYTVYTDELIRRLEESGIGCYIGHTYYGSPTYADDMTLICPSIGGLQKMVDICANFGLEYDILYNAKKTVCTCFTRKRQMPVFDIYLNGQRLECTEEVKHLGIYMRYDLSTETDILKKRGDFIGRTNHILSKYKGMASEVKCKMVSSHCCHYYGSETWNFNDKHFKVILTTWNIAIRHSWNLPYDARTYMLPILANHYARDIIFKKFLSLYQTFKNSSNNSIRILFQNIINDQRSAMMRNISVINNEWDTDSTDGRVPDYHLSEEQSQCINSLIEINHCLYGIMQVPGFSSSELRDMYECLATT